MSSLFYFRENMSNKLYQGTNERKQILPSFPERPSYAFTYEFRVNHSDTNMLYHANQSVYIKYFIDTAAEAAKLGHFQHVLGDPLGYRSKVIECRYLGESVAGDVLSVSVWENQLKTGELFCEIHKGKSKIWIGKIEFYHQLQPKL